MTIHESIRDAYTATFGTGSAAEAAGQRFDAHIEAIRSESFTAGVQANQRQVLSDMRRSFPELR